MVGVKEGAVLEKSDTRGLNRTVPAITLQVAWHDLIETLDLGPEPVTIRCPQCGAIVMRDATRCGHCWKYLNH